MVIRNGEDPHSTDPPRYQARPLLAESLLGAANPRQSPLDPQAP